MPKKTLVAITCILAGLSGPLRAQTTPPPVPPDLEELRKAYRDDENERKPIAPLPPPAVSHREVIRPSRLLWTCLGTWPGQPIYSEPDAHSTPIGMTNSAVAAGSDAPGGFVRVLMFSGKTGYVSGTLLHPYADPDHPGVTCTFSGLNPRGGAVLGFHEPGKG